MTAVATDQTGAALLALERAGYPGDRPWPPASAGEQDALQAGRRAGDLAFVGFLQSSSTRQSPGCAKTIAGLGRSRRDSEDHHRR